MKKNFFQRLVAAIALIGVRHGDSEEVRLQKSLLVISAIPFMIAGVLWGAMYISFGEKNAGAIPISYSLFSLVSIIYFSISGQFAVFRFSQLLLILLLPFALMISLGGFINGSAVILWSLICPLGAMLFDKPRNARLWFIAFLFLILCSGIVQWKFHQVNNFSQAQINLFFVINLAGVGGLIFLMVYYFVDKKNLYQQRSESLLLNILPREIIEILKTQQGVIAQHYDQASILFADVVNFTPLADHMHPTELVQMLNEVFSAFDERAGKYGLEKIKTIGDCYMIAAGVPTPRADHALVLTEMAMEMRDYLSQRTFSGRKLQFRFGINSGPVTAGVIGRRKFAYDLWGDSVNVASRMESLGQSNVIQVSQSTYQLIRHRFRCTQHGPIHVKGKGEMLIWFVEEKIG
jgi:adenylate cyclase